MVPRGEEHASFNWPANATMENCFAVHSPNRVLCFIAETEDGAKEWIEKVEEARKKVGSVVTLLHLFPLCLLFSKVLELVSLWVTAIGNFLGSPTFGMKQNKTQLQLHM